MSAQSAVRVGAAIGSATVSPLDAKFETEGLELLPAETTELFNLCLVDGYVEEEAA